MKTPEFYTAYNRPPSIPYKEDMPTLTQQHFLPDCNINMIMEKYRRTGVLPVNQTRALFGDFSDGFDFLTAQRQIAQAKEAFADLPAKLRKRFDNDPAQLIAFMEDPENRAEAEALGLVEKAKPPEPAPAAPTAAPQAAEGGSEPNPT